MRVSPNFNKTEVEQTCKIESINIDIYCNILLSILILTSIIMAWFSGSSTNSGLIQNLKELGIIRTPSVIQGLKSVDRANFVSNGSPYADSPQYIGCGQTISAPHMHGYALEYLAPQIMHPQAKILDVGVGSGYLAAAMSKMNPTATVYGIDIYHDLIDLAIHNVKREDRDLIDSGRVKLMVTADTYYY